VGLDRDQRGAHPAALRRLMRLARDWLQWLEFAASGNARYARSLKNQPREHQLRRKNFAVSLNTGFFLCYFRRRLGFVGIPAYVRTLKQEIIKMAKKNAAPTKSEILASISKDTELSKKQVGAVFDSLSAVIKKSLRGHGVFTFPGLLKMKVVKKPATKAREGINPFNGEKITFKAKPASKKVRIAALKTLKEFVN
jgi:nucleoid DNA-binding protein